MKIKLLLILALSILSSGCVAYIQQPDLVHVRVRPPVIAVQAPPIVHVHRIRRPVVRTVHHHHRHVVTRTHRHHRQDRHQHRCTRRCRRH